MSNLVLKIVKILMEICESQIDIDVSFWVGQNKLTFELEHRYGGDLLLRAKIVDEMNPYSTVIWSNYIYCGIWTEKAWTIRPSDTTRLVEQAIVAAKKEQ